MIQNPKIIVRKKIAEIKHIIDIVKVIAYFNYNNNNSLHSELKMCFKIHQETTTKKKIIIINEQFCVYQNVKIMF